MRQLSVFALSLFLLGLRMPVLNAQDLLVRMYDGTEYVKPLNTIQNLTFPTANLLLSYTNSTTDAYLLSDVRSLHFDTGPMAVENAAKNDDKTMSVFPNPAVNMIYLQNIPDATNNVKIFNLYGALILDLQLAPGSKTINVSSLIQGLYIIKMNNYSFKFNKL